MKRLAIGLLVLALALTASSSTLAGVDEGDTPELDVTTVDGTDVDLEDWRGKVVLIDFWATWCAPCQTSLPFYQRLADEYDDAHFRILAVSVDETRKPVTRFLDKHDLSFPVAVDADHAIAEQFEPGSMPTLFILGPDGTVERVHEGFEASDRAELTEQIEVLVDRARDREATDGSGEDSEGGD